MHPPAPKPPRRVVAGLAASSRVAASNLKASPTRPSKDVPARSRSPRPARDQSSVSLGGEEENTAESAMSDATSQRSSATTALASRGMLAEPAAEVLKWTSKLPLIEIMAGKCDTQVHHADVAAQKLHKQGHEIESKQLKAYLRNVYVARSLRPNSLRDLEQDDLNNALQVMMKHTGFPDKVMVALVRRQAKEKVKTVADMSSFEDYMQVCWPWPIDLTKPKQAFDPMLPKVSELPVPTLERVQLFDYFVCAGFFADLVSKGKCQSAFAESIADRLMELAEAVVGSDEHLGDDEANYVCALIATCSALKVIIQPGSFLMSGEMDAKYKELNSLRSSMQLDSECSFMKKVAIALDTSEFYANNCSLLLKAQGVLADLAPTVQELKEISLAPLLWHATFLGRFVSSGCFDNFGLIVCEYLLHRCPRTGQARNCQH